MDYKKSGGARAGRNAPRHTEKGAPGGRDNPFGAKKPKGDTQGGRTKFDKPAAPEEDFAVDEHAGKPMRGHEGNEHDHDERDARDRHAKDG